MPTALITGATSGIGAAFARHLAQRGYRLVLVARDRDRLEGSREALRSSGSPQVEVLPADLTVPADRDRVVARLEQGVDLLVNNAGIGLGLEMLECTPADLQRQIDLNVTAVVLLARAALPGMIERGHGGVINVASIAGLLPGRGSTYAGSKAFLISLSEGMNEQLKEPGVRMQALCPGFVKTEFHQRAGIDMSPVPKFAYVDVDTVVTKSLADLRANRVVSVPGAVYRTVATFADLAPRSAIRALASRVYNRGRT